ncbi:hypothetical protein BS47DRAFT_1355368 [Hydnum rufescens UP504]|uniref:Uncharacterized protein n=1 Tax=Hydnum rufescens UP504 TaxID=1448309 RepID=A0A9P6DN64_9AGAM|nr:hypothetical protein BS47DRAFT_1355368 [Hydnum rufescens UP504]
MYRVTSARMTALCEHVITPPTASTMTLELFSTRFPDKRLSSAHLISISFTRIITRRHKEHFSSQKYIPVRFGSGADATHPQTISGLLVGSHTPYQYLPPLPLSFRLLVVGLRRSQAQHFAQIPSWESLIVHYKRGLLDWWMSGRITCSLCLHS